MFSAISAFLAPYKIWLYLVIFSVVIGAGWYVVHKYNEGQREIGRAEVRKALQPKIDAAEDKVKSLSSVIEIQNNHIANLGIETEAAKKRGLEAQKKAKVIVGASEKKIEALRRVPVSSVANTTCSDQLNDIKSLLDEAHR